MLVRIETVAFLALLILTLLRLPSAIREPSSRLTWIATITGLAAIFMVGVAVPLPVVDGWLGGTNVANLVQNLLATTAFWFVMQAARTLDGTRFNPRTLWELPVMLLSFTIPFLLIADRGATTDDFIKETADQLGLWAYASIYMGCVVFIMTRMLRGIRGRKPRPYMLIRIGAWAILVASLIEIVYLTLRVAGQGRTPPVEFSRQSVHDPVLWRGRPGVRRDHRVLDRARGSRVDACRARPAAHKSECRPGHARDPDPGRRPRPRDLSARGSSHRHRQQPGADEA